MALTGLIRRAGVSLRIGAANFGRPKGQIQIQDSRGTQTITDFDTAAGDIYDTITEGRTVSLSWSANLVTSDAGYQAAKAAYEADTVVTVTVEAVAEGGGAATWTYTGLFSQMNITLNESGVAECSFTFVASGVGGGGGA